MVRSVVLARVGAAVTAASLALAASAAAAPDPQPYRTNDPGGFWNIAPPGANGRANGPELALFLTAGQRPSHNDEQLAMYGDLVYASPGLKAEDLPKYFKDASFGVRPEDIERTYSPRSDVTVVRDKQFGVPHVYGDTREGAMFALGYVAAEDRLFFIDVLRHLGRAQLSSFAGGAQGNRDFDADQWSLAPYTEADLQRQIDQGDDLFGADGVQGQADIRNYTAGVQAYINQARLDPTKMPGEYAAIGKPGGPDDWKETDAIAIASLVGGIFGKGGGNELGSAEVLQAAQRRFGARRGKRVWRDFRSAEDPEAPTTVHRGGRTFPYQRTPRRIARGSLGIPDPGTLKRHEFVAEETGGGSQSQSKADDSPLNGLLDGLKFPQAASNALLVSAAESESGHPLAVFGPQTGYFAPQILMEQDVHAPTLDARGAAFPGVNLYVQLGRGRDYAWSATSAGQDNIDTFALDLCEPDGSTPSLDSMHYLYRGACRPIEVLERKNCWEPNLADSTPAGCQTLRSQRTLLGIVAGRAEIRGRPVAYAKLRSTYFHEVDAARGFSDFNDPSKIRSAQDFQRAASKIDYTFNWFYADSEDIAYYNSGDNPVRGAGTDPNFPVRARKRFEWAGFKPGEWTATWARPEQHPQVVNQRYLTSWNNKQAPGYRAADDNFGFHSVYRVKPLDDRIEAGTRGAEKMTLVELIDAMEDSATVDLRGDAILPLLLRAIGERGDAKVRDAVAKLSAWRRDGAHRIDRDRNGTYEHSDAIAIMDAWWPLLLDAEFKPSLGSSLFAELQDVIALDNEPNNHGDHLGSAYQTGWYGYVSKDLRTLLGDRVVGRYSRTYCGGQRGRREARARKLARCGDVLTASLSEAIDKSADRAALYEDRICSQEEDPPGDAQWCFDAVWHRPLGGVTQPLIHWHNRPTFQQAVEVPARAPR